MNYYKINTHVKKWNITGNPEDCTSASHPLPAPPVEANHWANF